MIESFAHHLKSEGFTERKLSFQSFSPLQRAQITANLPTKGNPIGLQILDLITEYFLVKLYRTANSCNTEGSETLLLQGAVSCQTQQVVVMVWVVDGVNNFVQVLVFFSYF